MVQHSEKDMIFSKDFLLLISLSLSSLFLPLPSSNTFFDSLFFLSHKSKSDLLPSYYLSNVITYMFHSLSIHSFNSIDGNGCTKCKEEATEPVFSVEEKRMKKIYRERERGKKVTDALFILIPLSLLISNIYEIHISTDEL